MYDERTELKYICESTEIIPKFKVNNFRVEVYFDKKTPIFLDKVAIKT